MHSHLPDLSQALEEQLLQFETNQKIVLREQLEFLRIAVQRVVELHDNFVIKPLHEEKLSLHSKLARLEGPGTSPLRLSAMRRKVSAGPEFNSQATGYSDLPSQVNSKLSVEVANPESLPIGRLSTGESTDVINSGRSINLSDCGHFHIPACKEDSESEWMPLAMEWDTGGAPHITMHPSPRLELPSGRKVRDLMPKMYTAAIQQPSEHPAIEKPPECVNPARKVSIASTLHAGNVMTDVSTASIEGQASPSKMERLERALSQVRRVTRASCALSSLDGSQMNSHQEGSMQLPADEFYLHQMWRDHLSCILARNSDPESSQPTCDADAGAQFSFSHLFRSNKSFARLSVYNSRNIATYLWAVVQNLVLSPCCGKRLCWDLISMVLTLYDLIMIPLIVFDLPETNFSTFMFWFTISFWTFDIFLSFFTGVQTSQGMEMQLHRIAVIYTKSWMAIDVLIMAPEWTMVFANSSASGGDSGVQRLGKLLKVMRFVRSIRLLRIFRFTKALSGVQDRFKSEFVLNLVDFGKLVGGLVFLNHYLSCLWFLIGTVQEDGWVDKYSMRTMEKEYQYLTSMHWSISQFHGSMEVNAQTSWERLVSIATAFLGLTLASLFISSITNLIMRMQKLHQETFLKTRKLLRYLNENGISQNLTWRIKRFNRLTANATVTRLQDVELLNALPAHLLEEIMVETKAPGLQINAVLKHCVHHVPQAKKQLCQEVLKEAFVNSGGLVFGHDEQSGQMFLILKGKVMYHRNSWVGAQSTVTKLDSARSTSSSSLKPSSASRIISGMLPPVRITLTRFFGGRPGDDPKGTNESEMKISAGHFISEMNLWTLWRHRGDCVVSGCATIFSVDAISFGKVLMLDKNHHVELALHISHYAAQYVNWLNTFDALGDTSQHLLHDCASPDLAIVNVNSSLRQTPSFKHVVSPLKSLKCIIRRSFGV